MRQAGRKESISDLGATAYFQELSEILLNLQVTDREDVALSIDQGADEAVETILAIKEASRKVMLIGNGGSAAVVSHMQNDLCKAVGARAIVFNEPPLMTALSNDDGYECVFERLVDLWASTGDLLIAVSSSGQSENILRAVRAATRKKCHIITCSGFDAANPLRRMGDVNFYAASGIYGFVEITHAALAHLLTDKAKMSNRNNE